MNSPSKVPLILISYISSVLRRAHLASGERGDGDGYGVLVWVGIACNSLR